jgi:hypothetical protein
VSEIVAVRSPDWRVIEVGTVTSSTVATDESGAKPAAVGRMSCSRSAVVAGASGPSM